MIGVVKANYLNHHQELSASKSIIFLCWVKMIYSGGTIAIVGAVIGMMWSEVRKMFPNQFVLLEDIKSHIEEGKLFVEEVAVIRPLADSQEALQAMKSAHDRRFIYHTKNDRIVMDIVVKPMVRGVHS